MKAYVLHTEPHEIFAAWNNRIWIQRESSVNNICFIRMNGTKRNKIEHAWNDRRNKRGSQRTLKVCSQMLEVRFKSFEYISTQVDVGFSTTFLRLQNVFCMISPNACNKRPLAFVLRASLTDTTARKVVKPMKKWSANYNLHKLNEKKKVAQTLCFLVLKCKNGISTLVPLHWTYRKLHPAVNYLGSVKHIQYIWFRERGRERAWEREGENKTC